MRAIAAFEAVKGFAALAASAGLLSLLHHDLHHVAKALISHVGLKPGDHYPAILLHYVDVVRDANLRSLVLVASGYVVVRLLEAYGLWNATTWGQWLGALSGALYVPFEVWHLMHRPTAASSIVLVSNIVVVGFLAWQLWRQRRSSAD